MNIYVLIRVSDGVVSDVRFYENLAEPIRKVTELLKSMNLDKESAAIFSREGMILNTAHHVRTGSDRIFIIADPVHSLGFLVTGYHEPVGYSELVKALYHLERKRKDLGRHIGLYEAIPAKGIKIGKSSLKEYVLQQGYINFEYQLVSEYLDRER